MTTSLPTFLTNVSSVVTAALGWMEDILDVIMSTPALFVICIAIPLCTVAVNLLNRLIRL